MSYIFVMKTSPHLASVYPNHRGYFKNYGHHIFFCKKHAYNPVLNTWIQNEGSLCLDPDAWGSHHVLPQLQKLPNVYPAVKLKELGVGCGLLEDAFYTGHALLH
jgi:hypothetical protein